MDLGDPRFSDNLYKYDEMGHIPHQQINNVALNMVKAHIRARYRRKVCPIDGPTGQTM